MNGWDLFEKHMHQQVRHAFPLLAARVKNRALGMTPGCSPRVWHLVVEAWKRFEPQSHQDTELRRINLSLHFVPSCLCGWFSCFPLWLVPRRRTSRRSRRLGRLFVRKRLKRPYPLPGQLASPTPNARARFDSRESSLCEILAREDHSWAIARTGKHRAGLSTKHAMRSRSRRMNSRLWCAAHLC